MAIIVAGTAISSLCMSPPVLIVSVFGQPKWYRMPDYEWVYVFENRSKDAAKKQRANGGMPRKGQPTTTPPMACWLLK